MGRSLTFGLMFMYSTSFLLAKTLGMALLARASMSYLWIYLVGDMVMFLIYKIARKDFWYW